MKTFIAGAIVFASLVANADTKTVLTLTRVNYKNYKLLHYDIEFDSQTCSINTKRPFDVYYEDIRTGERMSDFSSDSEKYFGPRIDSKQVSAHEAVLNFKSLEEIQKATGTPARIVVKVQGASGRCTTEAWIGYADQSYILDHMDIKVTKTFGFPTGVEWLQLKGHDDRGPIVDCVVGSCD